MIKTAFVFGTGMVTGVVALAAGAVYIKPVRNVVSKGIAKLFAFAYVNNEEVRTKTENFVMDYLREKKG